MQPKTGVRLLRCGGVVAALSEFWLLTWSGPCWAYIDPNAGGFLAQLLAPMVSVLAAFIFYCRREIAKFFSPGSRKVEQKQEESQEPERVDKR